MLYGLTVSVAPAIEPVTTADAKTHLRVETTDDDTYIDLLVATARQSAESRTHRAFITQTFEMTLDRFPDNTAWLHGFHGFSDAFVREADSTIYLPRSPVQSITSVQYVDDAGDTQTLDASKYTLDSSSLVPRLVPAFGEVWPTTQLVINAVTITFLAGYGLLASDVPDPLIHAIKLIVGTYYDPVRANVSAVSMSEIPQAADFLMGPYRVGTFAGLGA